MARNWKKMSKEDEDKKRQETIDKAIETMNKGVYEYLDSERFKTLLDTMSKFHDYSMNNTLLILEQNPHATHLAGYNKWQQDFNRQVKRGEKGLMIWMPVEIKVKENHYVLDENGNRILGDDGKFKREEVEVKKRTFKIGYTFDVSQTEQIEGKEVIELSPVKDLKGDVKDYQALTKALMEISPVPIKIEAFTASAKGCYNSLTNEITIQPDMSEVQTIKTMIHEIAHSIVHSEENLNQLKQKENVEFSKNEREVQAESIAYIVSSHLGIDTSDYSFPYVATWSLSTDPNNLENVKQNLKCIKSTSMDLTSKLDTYMEELQAQQNQNKDKVQIVINWSENGTVSQYSEESDIAEAEKLSFAEANELLKRMNEYLKDSMLGYDKTDYEITLYKENDVEPYVYSGRYDIGSENGDIIDTISHYLDWKIEHENDQNALLFKNEFIPEAEAGRKLSVDEAKRVDKIFDEMLQRELKYKTINLTRQNFETVDTARNVLRVEEKMDELYNNGDISGKTRDEVLNHLTEVEEALYEQIKENMENNTLMIKQVENAVKADGYPGYKRALYNQDDMYMDVVKDVLEIDDLQKDTDEMEL
ncbi:LPD25 domain-containing protein [Holdemanella biformis]